MRIAWIAALCAAAWGCAEGSEATGAMASGAGGSAGGAGAAGDGGVGGFGIGGMTSGACAAAVETKQSIGCEYYATYMDTFATTKDKSCFAAFVANIGDEPVHIEVAYGGAELPVADFTRIPSGSGPALAYAPFDAEAGLPPGEVAILFLSGLDGEGSVFEAPCPVPSAVPSGVPVVNDIHVGVTGIGKSFRIRTDLPVVAYQINPYGGGRAAVTGASLLLPTSTWDTSYVAVNAYGPGPGSPSLNIVAAADHTKVSFVAVADVAGGGGIPAGPAGATLSFELGRGEHAQLTELGELTGSLVSADKPIGFMAGHQCMDIPADSTGPCDHGEQMLPPLRALGSEYVGVMHRQRTTEPAIWRLVGAVDGTVLTWSSDVAGPSTLARGQMVELITAVPFVVKSQDEDHPFVLMQHMSSWGWLPLQYGLYYRGDPDAVLGVPPQQFLSSYVFFADPTYPITNVVVVRTKKDGAFADVMLDCAGVLGGWQPVGDYEWTRVDLSQGLYENVGACNTGRHEIESAAPFGIWVWGWGDPDTGDFDSPTNSRSVSYGYPGGMAVETINDVVIPPPE
jgi:IgGFc binding protein